LETKMLETRDMMSSPVPTAPLHQQVDKMQVRVCMRSNFRIRKDRCFFLFYVDDTLFTQII